MVIVEKLGTGQVIAEFFYGNSLVLGIPGIKTVDKNNIGELYVRDIYMQGTKEAATKLEFARIVDEPKLGTMDVVVPPTMLEYKFGAAEYQKIVNNGALDATRQELLKALAVKLDKWFLYGPNANDEAALLGLIYGFIDTANTDGSTRLKAKTCDGSTTAGTWDATAGAAQKDIDKLPGAIEAIFGDASNFALLYPRLAAAAFRQPLYTATSVYSGLSVGAYAKSAYNGGMFPVPSDKAGKCVMTGAADTKDAFQMACLSVDHYKIVKTKDIALDEWFNQDENVNYMRAQAYMSLVPVVTKVGTYWYKAMSEMASINA